MTDMKENKSMRDWLLKVLGRTDPDDLVDQDDLEYLIEITRNDLRIDEIVKDMEKLKNDVLNFTEQVDNKPWVDIEFDTCFDRMKNMRSNARQISHDTFFLQQSRVICVGWETIVLIVSDSFWIKDCLSRDTSAKFLIPLKRVPGLLENDIQVLRSEKSDA